MKKGLSLVLIFIVVAVGALMAFSPLTRHKDGKANEYPTFLFLSDIHLDPNGATTVYGGDTGHELWEAFLDKAGRVLSEAHAPGFIVYTGDLPSHYHCSGTCYLPPNGRAAHNANLTAILSGLQGLAARYHKPIFYLPGNNDAIAGNYYSFADEQQHTALSLVPPSPYFFPSAVHGVATPPCMVSAPHPTMGYYSAYPVKGLRLIALNTVIYNSKFKAVDGTNQQQDGDEQMNWLAGQLADAAAKNEKVYLAMHVPPGMDAHSGKTMWVQLPGTHWNNDFLKLAARYKGTIAGILYGHTHMEEVRRLYDSAGNHITTVAISCPGVTPGHYNNPGFKTVAYDAHSKELMDFTTYYTLPATNHWGDSSYTFSGAYGSAQGVSIAAQLKGMDLPAVANCMNSVFMVKHGMPAYITTPGIEVKME